MPTEHRPEFFTTAQVAVELGLTPRAVVHRIRAGTIAATKIGPGTAPYLITQDEMERLREAQRSRAAS